MDPRTLIERRGAPVSLVLGLCMAMQPVTLLAQDWVVGAPVNAVLSHLYLFAGSCTPDPSHRFSFPASPVTGVDYVAIVTQAYPGNAITMVPGPAAPLQTGDTIWITEPSLRELFYPLGGGTVQLEFRAIGIPSVDGEAHSCAVNDAWSSDSGSCPETVTVALLDDCLTTTVAAIAQVPIRSTWFKAWPSDDGATLLVEDPAIVLLVLYDAQGRTVRMTDVHGPGSIAFEGLPGGVYTVRALRNDRTALTGRFARAH